MTPLEFEMIEHEMPADGSKCLECNKVIEGKMIQYFLFEELEPTPTKYKYCEICYNGTDRHSK